MSKEIKMDKDWEWALRVYMMERKALEQYAKEILNDRLNSQ